MWGYKQGLDGRPVRMYGSEQNSGAGDGGIQVHADAAAVNVNIWLNEQSDYDEGGGTNASAGLLVHKQEPPADWGADKWNRGAFAGRWLEARGAERVSVPWRANRAVVFNSNYFHRTEEHHFRDGYAARRINLTFLFGKRGAAGRCSSASSDAAQAGGGGKAAGGGGKAGSGGRGRRKKKGGSSKHDL
eukprot:SAG22_NODE_2788_length_2210_cov_1.794410_2_plen_188_part_00